jgi:hypothetical protein
LSEVHVVIGSGFETATGGLLAGTETTGATGFAGGGANHLAAAGLFQFSGDEMTALVSLMISDGGCGGCVAQPARKTSAPQETSPANLNTRQLCGTEMRTQAFTTDDLRLTRELEQITLIANRIL